MGLHRFSIFHSIFQSVTGVHLKKNSPAGQVIVHRESSVCGDSIASFSSRCFLKLCFQGSFFSGWALKFLNLPSALCWKRTLKIQMEIPIGPRMPPSEEHSMIRRLPFHIYLSFWMPFSRDIRRWTRDMGFCWDPIVAKIEDGIMQVPRSWYLPAISTTARDSIQNVATECTIHRSTPWNYQQHTLSRMRAP